MQAFIAPKVTLLDIEDVPKEIRTLDELFRCNNYSKFKYITNQVQFALATCRMLSHSKDANITVSSGTIIIAKDCSVCINRALVFKDECPSCRAKYDDANTLKPNKFLDAIIKQYTKVGYDISNF